MTAHVPDSCPGEDLTLELLHRALRILSTDRSWRMPAQDLTMDLARIPALPRGGMVLERSRGPRNGQSRSRG